MGMMFGLKDGASSIASPIWGYLCDRFNKVKTYIVLTSLAAAVCFALFGPSPVLHIHQSVELLISFGCTSMHYKYTCMFVVTKCLR